MALTRPALRPERPGDQAAIRRLLQSAFGEDCVEADLVEALRASGDHVPELCLVAVEGERIVGHVFFSRARLESGEEVLALAPMAVLPDRQRRGVGSLLVEDSLRRASADSGHPLVLVLGHPGYYPRFGFEPAAALGVQCPWEVPDEAWMLYRLPSYLPAARGAVTYPRAFADVT